MIIISNTVHDYKIYIGTHQEEYYNFIFNKDNINDVCIIKDEYDNYEMCKFVVLEKNSKIEIEMIP